jgi:hypothetical protein
MAELRYELGTWPPAEQLAFVEASLRASFSIDTFLAADKVITIRHADESAGAALHAMLRRFLFVAKNINKDLVFQHSPAMAYAEDPQTELQRRGDVMALQPGLFSFQGDFLRVLQAVDRCVLDIAGSVSAVEQDHPAVWPVRLFKLIDYFHEFPQQMILCAPVKDDYGTRSLFSGLYRKDADFDSVPMNEHMADARYGLQPAVCDCCYYTLEGSRSHVDRFYTTSNKVFRNERSASDQLDRLTSFTVRDIMFVGSEPFVLEARQLLIERLSSFIEQLHLHARIETANDPFFANDSAMKSVFQTAHRLKYELLAPVPHLNKDIAVGSINLHTDFFGKAFDIRMADGSTAHSGCIGVGMERMSYALFCQHGPELSAWPAGLLHFLGLGTR